MTDRQSSRLKRRIFEILEAGAGGDTTSKIVDRVLIVLILINVVAVVLETVPSMRAEYWRTFQIIEIASVFLFTAEYLTRLWVADEHITLRHMPPYRARINYAIQPAALIDLFAILPFFVGFLVPAADLRFLRLFRLMRFLKLVRYSPALRSLGHAIASEKRALLACLVILFGIVLCAATALYLAERHAQADAFGSIPRAMWWAIATLTTVGYGDTVPITWLGQVIAGIVMVVGYGLFALPVGIIATAFAREIHQRDFVVTWGMVARVPLFSELSAVEIAQVMRLLHAQTVEAGTMIARAGEPAHSMYFLGSGEVEIELPRERVRLHDGAFFGEVAVLRKAERSANVVAISRCRLLLLEAEDLHRLMEDQPGIAARIREVAEERLGKEIITPGGDLVKDELVEDDDLADVDAPTD